MPPSPFRLLWLELAERQFLDLPDDTRALVDERLALLESDPAGLLDAIYDSASGQWSAPIGEYGLMLYPVVQESATVIVLRLVAYGGDGPTRGGSLSHPPAHRVLDVRSIA